MTDRATARIEIAAALAEAQEALARASKGLREFGDLRNYSIVSMLQHDVKVIKEKVESGQTYV